MIWVKRIGFENSEFSNWMKVALLRKEWAKLVDHSFSFREGTYERANSKNSNAVLKSYETLQQ